MNNQEKLKIEDAMYKIERNINLLEYVHDSVIEGSGIMKDEIFGGAVLEIISGLKEGIKMAMEAEQPEPWYYGFIRYMNDNPITAEQYDQICQVLGVSVDEIV